MSAPRFVLHDADILIVLFPPPTIGHGVQEVAESVDEFLALAATKYSIKSYLGPAPEFDVKKEYGAGRRSAERALR